MAHRSRAGRPGDPDKESSAPPGLGWRFLLILVFLLAVNVTVVSLIGPEQKTQRVRIPYSPVFLTQVREGNVKSISSKGETVQGELRRPVRYPPSDRKATRTTHFNTEVPSHYFAASAARQFDALVHIDHSRAVEPLERTQTWDLGEPPETYPTAL